MTTYFLDIEFDGHAGPLLSIALISQDLTRSFYYIATHIQARDPWVIDHVIPLLELDSVCKAVTTLESGDQDVGQLIRTFIGDDDHPYFIADSPVDIHRLTGLLINDYDGNWRSCDYPKITFEVANVDAYPCVLKGCVQHNAYYDALALHAKFHWNALAKDIGL